MADRWRDDDRYERDYRTSYECDEARRGSREQADEGSGLRYGEMSASERYRGKQSSTFGGNASPDHGAYARDEDNARFKDDMRSYYNRDDGWRASERGYGNPNDRGSSGIEYERGRGYGYGG